MRHLFAQIRLGSPHLSGLKRTMALWNAPETHQYTKGHLSETDVDPNPANQFSNWLKDAQDAKITIPEAVNLSTAELPSGRVSSRIVLLKEVDTEGKFVIYSNWQDSHKASDVASNPWVALTIWYKELERQIRVEGKAVRMTPEESQPYFSSRPRGSQIGAWSSKQSQPVESRKQLDDAVKHYEEKFKDTEVIPVPPFWGGIKIEPVRFEFWQGRPSRVHDRIEYNKVDGEWKIRRLSP